MNLTFMICYTEIKVLNVNILFRTFIFSSSAFNTEKCSSLCSSFYNTFRMEQFEFSPLMPLACQSNIMYMPCKWLYVK